MNNAANNGYGERYYRVLHAANDLKYFSVKIKESDLAIAVDRKSYSDSLLSLCQQELHGVRRQLEDYIKRHPEFMTSFVPLPLMLGAPEIACRMAAAAEKAGVGPMAAVAGAIAQSLGQALENQVEEVMVENGGDIYLRSKSDRVIAIFAGSSPFTYKIGIRVEPGESPLGICTSSATVGPSISLGRADAAVIKAYPAELADAVATQAGNLVQSKDDLIKAIDYAKAIQGVSGVLLIQGDSMAAWGNIEIIPLKGRQKNEGSK
ncbi:UPF0280 family protein [Syntrophomonas wolfei]|jgi:hypothetical protein|uniref:UPF0280 family protein n=1 Tax=Syntrophomonas wolfei TaxID=863 RepID=UPI0023F277BF|nr:UPF0280 family protein [Syntrophomonas wolfei]